MTGADIPVVVAGAGPVGLTLALGLARRGVPSVVLEQKVELDPHSRATLVVPRALEILAGLGVLPDLVARGQVNSAIEIVRPGDHRPVLTFDFAPLAGGTATPFALAVPQDRTERVLLAAAEATGLVDVRFGTPLREFHAGPDGVDVDAGPDGAASRWRARYLVGADGAHSAVRTALGRRLEGRTFATRAFLADVRVAPEADGDHRWVADPTAASFTLAVRFGHGVWRLIESAVPDAEVPDDAGPAALDARARALTGRAFGPGAWRETLWTSTYRKHERRVASYRADRVVLAGDAAHLNSPAGGQGLNAGLQDAHALAWRLGRLVDGRSDPEALLASYDEERGRSFDTDVRDLTGGIERMETLPGRVRSVLFSAAGLLRATPLPGAVARRLSMLDPTLVPSRLLPGRPPVGRRVPDVRLPDGARLYDHIGPDGLLLTGPGVPAGPGGLPAPATLPAPFAGHAALFVRPDHVVALAVRRGDPPSPAAIERALGGRPEG